MRCTDNDGVRMSCDLAAAAEIVINSICNSRMRIHQVIILSYTSEMAFLMRQNLPSRQSFRLIPFYALPQEHGIHRFP